MSTADDDRSWTEVAYDGVNTVMQVAGDAIATAAGAQTTVHHGSPDWTKIKSGAADQVRNRLHGHYLELKQGVDAF